MAGSVEVEASGSRRWIIGAYVGAFILVVGGAYIWLATLQSERLRVVRDGNVVSVEKGVFAPVGFSTYRPTEAFKPVSIDADLSVRVGECADLADCEARLFEAVAAQARRYLRRPDQMALAGELIAQAIKLSGASNREVMLELQGDEQYVKGMAKLDVAVSVLKEAQDHFYRARAMDSRTFSDSEERLRMVNGLLQTLSESRVGRPGDARPIPLPFKPEPPPVAPKDKGVEPPPHAERPTTPEPPKSDPPPPTEPPAGPPKAETPPAGPPAPTKTEEGTEL